MDTPTVLTARAFLTWPFINSFFHFFGCTTRTPVFERSETFNINTVCCFGWVAVLPFWPKYRLAHPGNYLFSLSVNILSGSKYPKNILFDFEKGSADEKVPTALQQPHNEARDIILTSKGCLESEWSCVVFDVCAVLWNMLWLESKRCCSTCPGILSSCRYHCSLLIHIYRTYTATIGWL